MTSKFKVIIAVGIIVIVAAIMGISKWSSTKNTTPAQDQTEDMGSAQPLPAPSGNVNDLLTAIDQSSANEGASATADADQAPAGEASDFDQSVNTNGI